MTQQELDFTKALALPKFWISHIQISEQWKSEQIRLISRKLSRQLSKIKVDMRFELIGSFVAWLAFQKN